MTSPRWLLLAHQLPARRSNARVKTWRRLQHVGAVPARNSVYVLPNTERCREDFEWIRAEIVALGGEATLFAADALDADGAADIVATFQRVREADYHDLKRTAERLLRASRSSRSRRGLDAVRLRRAVRALRHRFTEVEQIDFFNARGRQEVAASLTWLEPIAIERQPSGRSRDQRLSPGDFQSRRWVTRPRPGVDRMASAWLITRFIDAGATFAFVEQPGPSDVAFDMYSGDFGHRGSSCTFEVLAERFALTFPTIARVGQIVHDLDMKESRYAAPDTSTVGRLIAGLQLQYADDHVLLHHGIALFETLARSFESVGSTATAVRKRRRTDPSQRRRA